MQWEAWLSHRPTLVLARIFLGKLGKEDTLGLTLVQISNITTYFMLFSRSPSPGGKDATYKGCTCNPTFPAVPQQHSHSSCPEPPPWTAQCTRLQKRFLWSLSTLLKRAVSHILTPSDSFKKAYSKCSNKLLVCLVFLFHRGRGSPSCHATCPLYLCLLYLTGFHRTKIPHWIVKLSN